MAPPDVKAGDVAKFRGMTVLVKSITFLPGGHDGDPGCLVRYEYRMSSYQSFDCYDFTPVSDSKQQPNKENNMIPVSNDTKCCSLVHIQARNSTTADQLKLALRKVRLRKKHAAFVITRPDELTLVETVRSLDFAPVAEFKRCNSPGYLTMWVKRW